MTSAVRQSAWRTGSGQKPRRSKQLFGVQMEPIWPVYVNSEAGECRDSSGTNLHGGLSSAGERRARCTEHSVQRRLITEDGAVIWERLFCLVRMRPTGRTLKGQTICSPNVRLGKGKHGLVEGGQGETKAQVKDVPAFIIQLFSHKPSRTTNNALAATTGLPGIWGRQMVVSCTALIFH